MIYIVLDTNIWIYMSNGFDPQTNKYSEGNYHIELLQILKEKQMNGEIKILINEVVIIEWERNKHNTTSKIKKLRNKIGEIDKNFENNASYYSSDDLEIQKTINKRTKEQILKEIKSNEKHIENVEFFLKNECQKIPISDKVKLIIWELGVKKDVPFEKNKNNIGDATILFSSIEFIENTNLQRESGIFVSNNTDDYCETNVHSDFHPRLKQYIKSDSLIFAKNLSIAIQVSSEIKKKLEEIEKELEEFYAHKEYLNEHAFSCLSMFCQNNEDFEPWGYLDNKIKVINSSFVKYNPTQLQFFPEYPSEKPKLKEVAYGDCVICATPHIECPNCSELICDVSIWDTVRNYKCPHCEIDFKFVFEKSFEAQVLLVIDRQEGEINI